MRKRIHAHTRTHSTRKHTYVNQKFVCTHASGYKTTAAEALAAARPHAHNYAHVHLLKKRSTEALDATRPHTYTCIHTHAHTHAHTHTHTHKPSYKTRAAEAFDAARPRVDFENANRQLILMFLLPCAYRPVRPFDHSAVDPS